jgi:hypothetical protein
MTATRETRDDSAEGGPLRLRCIGCEVLARPLYFAAAKSPHIVDVELLRRGLHDVPVDLRARLQEMVLASDRSTYDAVVLGYALCGQATAGLRAGDLPLVVPRAHDCITLFLGDRERYQREFTADAGTFWYSQDYVERQDAPGAGLTGLGIGGSEDAMKATHAEYVERYGQDNADYLMEALGAWRTHYDRAGYIDMGVGDGARVEALARDDADRRGWRFEKLAGDIALIRRLLEGDWDRDFLVVQPGERVVMTYDDDVLRAEPVS